MNPASLTADSISVYVSGQRVKTTLIGSADEQSVTLNIALGSGFTKFSVIASAAVQDLAGNALIPFEANFTADTSLAASAVNSIHEIRPVTGAGISPTTPIVWFLDRPADLASVQANVLVLADGTPFPGVFDLSAGGRILRFTPAHLFSPGTLVTLYERTATLGQSQNMGATFTIAAAPDNLLHLVASTAVFSSPLDAVFEIQFSQDPPLGQNIATLNYSTGNGASVPLAFTESIPRPHVLRLTTTAPRRPGYYGITLSNKKVAGSPNSPLYLNYTLVATPLGGSPAVSAAGPAPGSTGIPLNASVRVLLGAALNPLSVTSQTAVISAGGRTLLADILFPQGPEFVLRPREPLPANSQVTVSLSGVEDLAGHTSPDLSWSFTTGSDVDYVPPTVLSPSLPDGNDNGPIDIAPNQTLQLIFSKPIDPGLAASGTVSSGAGFLSNAATFTLGPDLRTLLIAPVGTWAKGDTYDIRFNLMLDLSGNIGGGPDVTFRVAFDPITTPLHPVGISPPDASTGMPLNAAVIAVFDRPVYALPQSILLTDPNGAKIDLARQYTADPATLLYLPSRALEPDTAYTLTLSGLTDLNGNSLDSAITTGFTTGETPDYVSPTVTATFPALLPTNVPLRLRFSEPVSPATLTSRQIRVQLGNTPQQVSLQLASDAMSLTIIPSQTLIPGRSYSLITSGILDFAGNAATNLSGTFAPDAFADTTPPTITFIPSDGTTGVPASAPVYAYFSETADVVASPPVMRLLKRGKSRPWDCRGLSSSVTFRPTQALQYNTTYRAELSNVVDFAGNAAAAVSSTFTTSASALADAAPFRLSSTEPASGSVGVPNDSPLVFHFTKLLGSSSIAQAIILQANPGFPIFGTWSIQGSTATFTPKGPLPSATTFMVAIFNTFRFGGYFTDEAGVALDRSYSFSFTTAVRTDTTPPALISVTPAAGTPLSPISNTFTLLFSKPVVIGAQALQAYNGSQAAPTNGSYGQDAQTVIASVFVAADTVLTLVGTDGIKDDAGNSITPFTFQYPTLKANESGPPTVVSISPNGYAMDVSPTTPIKITFNKAMDPISLVGALHVTQDGQEITGRVEVLDSNHSLQFTPGLPYHAGLARGGVCSYHCGRPDRKQSAAALPIPVLCNFHACQRRGDDGFDNQLQKECRPRGIARRQV